MENKKPHKLSLSLDITDGMFDLRSFFEAGGSVRRLVRTPEQAKSVIRDFLSEPRYSFE
jgi:hypothetical protein